MPGINEDSNDVNYFVDQNTMTKRSSDLPSLSDVYHMIQLGNRSTGLSVDFLFWNKKNDKIHEINDSKIQYGRV